MIDLSDIPNFCAHEHWGSIGSIGASAEGFRADMEPGALPYRKTTLSDLVIEPYLGGTIANTGYHTSAPDGPAEFVRTLREAMRRLPFDGAYACTRRGIELAYGYDLSDSDPAGAKKVNEAVGQRYAMLFDWYRTMMNKAGFVQLIRPVHPVFYSGDMASEQARKELSFTHTVMRIDPLVEHVGKPRESIGTLADALEVEPRDAKTWRMFLNRLFDLAATQGCVGIKQTQAYRRSLDFGDAEAMRKGDVTEDWIVHECCRRAHDRDWPHQIHVGTHNLPESDPLPLERIAKRYSKQKIVLLHCWPYVDEAAFLAKQYANVYIDSCWLPVLGTFEEAMRTWLAYVPASKLMCSHDSTTVEMAAGSSLFVREILAELLAERGERMNVDKAGLRRAATDLLHDNAARAHGFPIVQ